MAPPETRSIADVPKKLIEDCNEHYGDYTVGFVRVERSERTEDAILLGSGVLVKVGDVCAILIKGSKSLAKVVGRAACWDVSHPLDT